ncbi:MAG TPA: arylamine N-acetyltransferase [Caldilineaceae bacterium]|nr:arylamine N-acetyltransferase [Caldilineaceae bacterium]
MSSDEVAISTAPVAGLDLGAYFRRIGYTGAREPALEVLQALIQQHTRTIAFENLNPWLRWPVYLDLASIQHKLVHNGRGGYCFEQNMLFSYVLEALGFSVTRLAARVVWNRPADTPAPRSHMLLCVIIEGRPYLADVGFGGMTPTGALCLEPDIVQDTLHEPYRLVRMGKGFLLQAEVGEKWAPLYRFDLHEQEIADYEVSNWYVSNHPQSHFVTGLTVARPDSERRYALHNTELAIHHRHGITERHTLTSVDELRVTLTETFHLTLPSEPAMDLALQRLVEQAGR